MLLFVLVVVCAGSVSGQEQEGEDPAEVAGEAELVDEFDLLEDAEVVESASRHSQDVGMSPSAITVFTREDIQTSGATSVSDLLRLVPGMDVIVESPLSPAVTARLFWTEEGNHFLVLVDGRDVTLEVLGTVFWEMLPISLEDIERIEVIRGPASSLYGPNAVGGVISITTRAIPEKTSAWGKLLAGEVGNVSLAARGSTVLSGFGISLSAGYDAAHAFSSQSVPGKGVRKARAVIERVFSEDRRLLLDVGISAGEGAIGTGFGVVDGSMGVRTARLSYDSKALSGQLYWTQATTEVSVQEPLNYSGVRLAEFVPADVSTHTFDGSVQWTLPTFWDPLLILVGGNAQLSLLDSGQLLDAETFRQTRRPGIDLKQGRLGAFVHAELSPWDWLVVTAGARADYNTLSPFFLSPRLALVFRPVADHFVRLGAARAFRKPNIAETHFHPDVIVPAGSPFEGSESSLREFMAQSIGNPDLDNEEITSYEVGYLARLLDGRLTLSVDLYFNQYTHIIEFASDIHERNGFPDISQSSARFENYGRQGDLDMLGSELAARFALSRELSLHASWAYREVFETKDGDRRSSNRSPKHQLMLGARLRLDRGLIGGLHLISRSDFVDEAVQSTGGMLAPFSFQEMPSVFMVLAKLGWRWLSLGGLELETGLTLLLPVSPFQEPYFAFFEKGGMILPDGSIYGGDRLCRMVNAYLQGSF